MEDPTVSSKTFSPKVYLRASTSILLRFRHSYLLTPRPLLPLPNAFLEFPRKLFSCGTGKARWVTCAVTVTNSRRDSPLPSVCFPFIVGSYGLELFPKSVLSCWNSLLICRSHRDSMQNNRSSYIPEDNTVQWFCLHVEVTSREECWGTFVCSW
jgi:hypothetical protein